MARSPRITFVCTTGIDKAIRAILDEEGFATLSHVIRDALKPYVLSKGYSPSTGNKLDSGVSRPNPSDSSDRISGPRD